MSKQKPTPVVVNIERIVELGPVACGISEIVIAQDDDSPSEAHVASVLVTAPTKSAVDARKFQNELIAIIGQAVAKASQKVIVDPTGLPATTHVQ